MGSAMNWRLIWRLVVVCTGRRQRQYSMRSVAVIVVDILGQGCAEMTFADNQQTVGALGAHGPHPSLGKGIRFRCSYRRLDHGRSRRVPRQLPAAPGLFTGRTAELATLTDMAVRQLDAGNMVVISAIGGAGGIGKTAGRSASPRRRSPSHPDRGRAGQTGQSVRCGRPTAGTLCGGGTRGECRPRRRHAAMSRAGYKVSVIPTTVQAQLGVRTLPGIEADVLATIDDLIGPGVSREFVAPESPVQAPIDSSWFTAMADALRAEGPAVVVVLYCMGGTDAKSFSTLGIDCYGCASLWLPAGSTTERWPTAWTSGSRSLALVSVFG
jgi:hypothetical protein